MKRNASANCALGQGEDAGLTLLIFGLSSTSSLVGESDGGKRGRGDTPNFGPRSPASAKQRSGCFTDRDLGPCRRWCRPLVSLKTHRRLHLGGFYERDRPKHRPRKGRDQGCGPSPNDRLAGRRDDVPPLSAG